MMKLLVELRPAMDGHAGIPQETRLLFRGLATLDGLEVQGLLQSSNKVLAPGLPAGRARMARALPLDKEINKLSRVVISLELGGAPTRIENLRAAVKLALSPFQVLVRNLLRLRAPLYRFDAHHFKDFVWRALYARTLPFEDFDLVTRASYRVLRHPWASYHRAALATRRFGRALYSRVDTDGFDVVIAETPFPGRVRQPTTLVVRYHDAIPLLMPHTIKDKSYHQAAHYHALRRNVMDGAWFACVSDATRKDLVSVFPEVEPRAVTIHNMVSHHYFFEESPPDRVPEILRTRRNVKVRAGEGGLPQVELRRGGDGLDYLLMVSTIEPRKNHLALVAAWEQLRTEGFGNMQLVLVGALGWDHAAIVEKMRPWLARGALHVLEDVPAPELRLLYRHARVTVCPSFGEGFDFSGVEAMRCGGVVAASDIPVHRDIYGVAAAYFNPYSASELASCLGGLMGRDAGGTRDALRQAGREVSARYLPERILPQWQNFLDMLRQPRRTSMPR